MCTVGGPPALEVEEDEQNLEMEMKGKGPRKYRCNDCETQFTSKKPECPVCYSDDVVAL